jgi:hypothetical protein
MASSGVLRRVTLVRTEVSEEFSAPFIRVTRIGELGTTLAVTSNRHARCEEIPSGISFLRSVCRLLVTASVVPSSPILVTLMKEELSSSETSLLTRAAWRNIPEDAILHSHRREDLKSYMETACVRQPSASETRQMVHDLRIVRSHTWHSIPLACTAIPNGPHLLSTHRQGTEIGGNESFVIRALARSGQLLGNSAYVNGPSVQ